MIDVIQTLLLWPLPWVAIAMLAQSQFGKRGPVVSVAAMFLGVVGTALFFGAPNPDHILTALMVWPALGGIIVLFMPRQWGDSIRRFASTWMWAGFVLSLFLMGPVVRVAMADLGPFWQREWTYLLQPFFGAFADAPGFTEAGYRFVEDQAWIESFGVHYKVGIDGISFWLVMLTTLLAPLALDVSWNSVNTKVKEFAFAFLLLEVGMLGAFVSLDLFLFYIFWELMLVPMYLIIGVWGGKERVYAAVKFFIYTMVGSLLMLVALVYVVYRFQELDPAHVLTFDLQTITARLVLSRAEQWVLFFAFALAFAIKVPMFPFHTWLPDAHVQAPTGGSVILAAVLLKLGGYGFIRFAIPMFAGAFSDPAIDLVSPVYPISLPPTLSVLAVVGIVYGAYCAWVQRDIKKLVAYSSVSHLGFVMLGIFSMTQGGLEGAILQMVSHGISTGALFILVGVIYDRRHTRELAEFGGIAKVMPIYATLFIIVTMSSIGLPGTNGFIGEFMVLSSTFNAQALGNYQKALALVAATGVILAAIYMLHAVLKTFWGPLKNEKNKELSDLTGREKWILAPFIVLIFWIGLTPNFFLNPMRASVRQFRQDWTAASIRAAQQQGDEARVLPDRSAPAAEEAEAEAAAQVPADHPLAAIQAPTTVLANARGASR